MFDDKFCDFLNYHFFFNVSLAYAGGCLDKRVVRTTCPSRSSLLMLDLPFLTQQQVRYTTSLHPCKTPDARPPSWKAPIGHSP